MKKHITPPSRLSTEWWNGFRTACDIFRNDVYHLSEFYQEACKLNLNENEYKKINKHMNDILEYQEHPPH